MTTAQEVMQAQAGTRTIAKWRVRSDGDKHYLTFSSHFANEQEVKAREVELCKEYVTVIRITN